MVASSARYRELSPLAEGGMATLSLALRDDGTEVVIKRVRPPFDRDPVFNGLFLDEGRLCGVLDHELFPALLEQGADERGPYLVFEFVAGTDLAHVLESSCARGEGFELPVFFGVALPLLRAVAYAHALVDEHGQSLDVIHRDISPGNVLLSFDGDVKLADFGVATSSLKTEHTAVGELKGKYAYMAPEQTRGERLDGRADLFAVGVVLWECLAGRRLFDATTDADVVQAVRHAEVPDVRAWRSDVPVELAALLAELLAKEAMARPASAAQALRHLEEAAGALGLDRGGRSHVARCARAHPRKQGSAYDGDLGGRRRTQRVLQGVSPENATVRRLPPSSSTSATRRQFPRWALVGAGLLVVVSMLVPEDAGDLTLDDGTTTVSVTSSTKGRTEPVAAPSPLAPAGPAPTGAPATASSANRALASPPQAAPGPQPARPSPPRARPVRQSATASAPPAAAGFGVLMLDARPWANVSVDGVDTGRHTPLLDLRLPAGDHDVVLENPVYQLRRRVRVRVRKDDVTRQFVDLTRDPEGP